MDTALFQTFIKLRNKQITVSISHHFMIPDWCNGPQPPYHQTEFTKMSALGLDINYGAGVTAELTNNSRQLGSPLGKLQSYI